MKGNGESERKGERKRETETAVDGARQGEKEFCVGGRSEWEVEGDEGSER